MIGVIVPVHDEAHSLGDCLASLAAASRHAALAREPVEIVVVLDRCHDASGRIARRAGATVVRVDAGNVGCARAAGAALALAHGARWIATTDADTRVSNAWLAEQLALGADMTCGTVDVAWNAEDAALRSHYERHYRDADGHRHVHGANLGISARSYRRAGGFIALPCHEDVALVSAVSAIGASVAWTARPRVTTSARRAGRVHGGFADTLARMARMAATA